MITLDDVSYHYQQNPVLSHLHVTIEKGEFVFLTGTSGSGKSTLLKLLYRELTNYEGNIYINQQPLEHFSPPLLRQQLGIIFQDYGLLETKTVLENVQLAGEIRGMSPKKIAKVAKECLSHVGLDEKEDCFPSQLSGGEQQRVAIARALLTHPMVLLADEPTGNLDKENALRVMDLLYERNQQQGITTLIVTHSEELLSRYPARVLRMEKGVIV